MHKNEMYEKQRDQNPELRKFKFFTRTEWFKDVKNHNKSCKHTNM